MIIASNPVFNIETAGTYGISPTNGIKNQLVLKTACSYLSNMLSCLPLLLFC